MKYVLDSSVAFKWLVPEMDSDKANQLRDDSRHGIHELLAPDFFPFEVAHALTRAERQGRVSTANGYVLWTSMMADCPRLHAALSLMPRAYTLSSQVRIGIFDCIYIALAEQEQCELLTADVRLLNALRGVAPVVSLDSL